MRVYIYIQFFFQFRIAATVTGKNIKLARLHCLFTATIPWWRTHWNEPAFAPTTTPVGGAWQLLVQVCQIETKHFSWGVADTRYFKCCRGQGTFLLVYMTLYKDEASGWLSIWGIKGHLTLHQRHDCAFFSLSTVWKDHLSIGVKVGHASLWQSTMGAMSARFESLRSTMFCMKNQEISCYLGPWHRMWRMAWIWHCLHTPCHYTC